MSVSIYVIRLKISVLNNVGCPSDLHGHPWYGDAWMVKNGSVLYGFSFFSQRPGGELMTLTLADEDAEADYVSLHRPYVVERYASDAIIGVVGKGKSDQAEGAVKSGLLDASARCDVVANLEAGERLEDGGSGRHAKCPVGESSSVRECLLQRSSQRHLRGLCHDLFCGECQDLE